jgi:hypothetical protein
MLFIVRIELINLIILGSSSSIILLKLSFSGSRTIVLEIL